MRGDGASAESQQSEQRNSNVTKEGHGYGRYESAEPRRLGMERFMKQLTYKRRIYVDPGTGNGTNVRCTMQEACGSEEESLISRSVEWE